MTLPPPRRGLVIRYAFLWSHEAASGKTEATKDRPCAIVLSVKTQADGETAVTVAPITHTQPIDPTAAIELPDAVKSALGLDRDRQWLCVDEINRFTWPGYDLRPLPGRPDRFDYGMLPKGLFEQALTLLLQRARAGRTAVHPRD